MRLLLLTLYYAPDDTSANAVIMTELAEQLVALGHDVTVVTSFPHYARNVIEPAYRRRLFQTERRNGVRVVRTYLYTSPRKNSLWRRLLNYASFNLLSTLAAIVAGRVDVILAPSPPLTIGLSAWAVGRARRAPYVYNVQDIYPDIAVRLGMLTNRRAITFFRRVEQFVYRHAAAITVLSPGFRDNLLAKGVPAQKMEVIPNFVDTDFVHPLPRANDFARAHGLVDKFVLLYAGNVGLSQDLGTAVAAAAQLTTLPDFRLLIVGNGAARSGLQETVASRSLHNVLFLPFLDRNQLPALYASADIALVSLRRDIGAESVPSKVYTIMASGRPLLAAVASNTATHALVTASESGLVVPPEDPDALVAAVQRLYRDPALRRCYGENGRRYVTSHHRPATIARQYAACLQKVANGGTLDSFHHQGGW